MTLPELERHIAVVVIGRNEGLRLRVCLASALAAGGSIKVVYVDSGSIDDSVAMARSLGCEVVELDMDIPFTAARARNEGFTRAMLVFPELEFIQFVDGDCEIAEGWINKAIQFLQMNPPVAAACGRRRERYPEKSIYNQLCDIEWNTPIGEARYFGGDVMIRTCAFQTVGGYRAQLIAGEEPELSIRLRAKGWAIWRLDSEMTLHDAAIQRVGQWWNRSKRAGYAFAAGAALHGAHPTKHWVRESRSAWIWGLAVPVLAGISMVVYGPWGLLPALVYPIQVLRLTLRYRKNLARPFWYSFFLVLSKFPEVIGQLKFLIDRIFNKNTLLIEYK